MKAMMNLSKPNSHKGPGTTVLKIFLCTLLVATVIVAYSPYLWEKIDLFMDNIRHQVYTFVTLFVIIAAFVIYKTIRRNF